MTGLNTNITTKVIPNVPITQEITRVLGTLCWKLVAKLFFTSSFSPHRDTQRLITRLNLEKIKFIYLILYNERNNDWGCLNDSSFEL